jgi:hypothetical protein
MSMRENSQSAPAEHVHYVDRETGALFRTPFEMIDAYLERFARASSIEPVRLDATGYVQIRRKTVSVGVNVLEENGVLMLVAPMGVVPGEHREAYYRRLLELSFLATADAAFAIDGAKDTVYVRALRRLSGLDYEEFADLLATIGEVVDEWDAKLRAEFS